MKYENIFGKALYYYLFTLFSSLSEYIDKGNLITMHFLVEKRTQKDQTQKLDDISKRYKQMYLSVRRVSKSCILPTCFDPPTIKKTNDDSNDTD